MTAGAPDTAAWQARPFAAGDAASVCQWVASPSELLWLAPGTGAPLTPEKVTAWTTSGDRPVVLTLPGSTRPVAYGELNPMPGARTHLWLGHILVDPRVRRCGVGRGLVAALLRLAFTRLAARRVSLVVFPDNTAAIRCYTQVGLRRGNLHEQPFGSAGQVHAVLRMSVTERQYHSFIRQRIRLQPDIPCNTTAATSSARPSVRIAQLAGRS